MNVPADDDHAGIVVDAFGAISSLEQMAHQVIFHIDVLREAHVDSFHDTARFDVLCLQQQMYVVAHEAIAVQRVPKMRTGLIEDDQISSEIIRIMKDVALVISPASNKKILGSDPVRRYSTLSHSLRSLTFTPHKGRIIFRSENTKCVSACEEPVGGQHQDCGVFLG